MVVCPERTRCVRPSCTQRQCVTNREWFYWVDGIFLQVVPGSLPLFLPLRDTGFRGLTQDRLGCLNETVARVQAAIHGLAVAQAVSLVGELFGALVLAVAHCVLCTLRRISGGAMSDST